VGACSGLSESLTRKTLAVCGHREGPVQSGIFGLAQPLVDAVKLLYSSLVLCEGVSRVVLYAILLVGILSASLVAPLTLCYAYCSAYISVTDFTILLTSIAALSAVWTSLSQHSSISCFAQLSSARSHLLRGQGDLCGVILANAAGISSG
jgi:NADH:ubiquinone oxidoreductase subunit H